MTQEAAGTEQVYQTEAIENHIIRADQDREPNNRRFTDDVKKIKKCPEDVLRTGRCLGIPVIGWSMYPLLVPGRDIAVIAPFAEIIDPASAEQRLFPSVHRVKRGDIVLFRRTSGTLVLHRVFKVSDGLYSFVGDNMPAVENGIREDQLIGMVTEIDRNGRKIYVTGFGYRLLSWIWLQLRPLRPLIHSISRALRQCLLRRFR